MLLQLGIDATGTVAELVSFYLIMLLYVVVASAFFICLVAFFGVVYRRIAHRDRSSFPKTSYEIDAINHEDIIHSEEYVTLNGCKFYRQSWSPSSGKASACILFVHGINAHGGSFARIAPYICGQQKLKVVSYDIRGHGRTEGIHAFVNNVDEVVEDVRFQLEEEKARHENDGLRLFLLGISFGGLVTLQFLRKYGDQIQGAILMCPLIKTAGNVHPPQPVVIIGRLLRSIFPEAPLAAANRGRGFSDPEMLQEALNSPIVYGGKLRVGTGFALKESFEDLVMNLHEITAPFLLQHGDRDSVVHIDGSFQLRDENSSSDSLLKVYSECEHVLFCEPMERRQPILDDLCKWVHDRSLNR